MKITIIAPDNVNFHDLKRMLFRSLMERNERLEESGEKIENMVDFDSSPNRKKNLSGPMQLSIGQEIEGEDLFADILDSRKKKVKKHPIGHINRDQSGII